MTGKNKESSKKFKFKFLYIFILGIILHMIFVQQNTFFNYLKNTSGSGSRTGIGMLKGLYGTFAYAGPGMIVSIILITPLIFFLTKKDNRNIYGSIAYALCIGLIFRLASYLL